MITKFLQFSRVALGLGLGLWTTSQCFAGGGGGGGGFGGGGGGGGGRGGGGGGGGFGGGGAGAGAATTRTYPNATSPGPVSVSIDPDSGNLLVSTDEKTFASISNLIQKIDVPKPEVLINVVFLEVTHDNSLDIGVEGQYTHVLSGSSIASNVFAGAGGMLTTNFFNTSPVTQVGQGYGLAAQGITGSQIGSSTMPQGAGLATLGGDNFTATLRAAEAKNNLDIVSRPSIVVRNNQPANLLLGSLVPIPNNVTYSGTTGLPIVTTVQQQVGITLDVTPTIHGNHVEMILNPGISSLSSASVTIAPGYTEPIIDSRSVNTVVDVEDGSTVVIGGLMENDKAAVDSKIPLLGDIPLLGVLFKHTQRDHTRTELVVFVTPHIINTPAEFADMSERESGRVEMGKYSFTEKELNQIFDKVPFKPVSSAKKN